MPRARISMAKSTSRIAFLVTIPISIRMPISTGIDSGVVRDDQRRRHPADGQRQREEDGERLDHRAEQQDQHRQHQHQAHASSRCRSCATSSCLHLGIARFRAPCTVGGSSTRRHDLVEPRGRRAQRHAHGQVRPDGRRAVRGSAGRPCSALRRSATSATADSGTVPPVAVVHLQRRDPRQISREASSSCTRTGISRLSIDSLPSAASTSPMVATRTTVGDLLPRDAQPRGLFAPRA